LLLLMQILTSSNIDLYRISKQSINADNKEISL
jgi:hypothetical protein